jgi:hypothetical protein
MNTARILSLPRAPSRFRDWCRKQGMGSLACSVMIHAWMAGVAMTLVWKYWEGFSEPEASLIKPNDGGARGSRAPERPKLRMAALTAERKQKVIASKLPSLYSLSTRRGVQSGIGLVNLPDIQGAGWFGGHGSGILRGEGSWGAGSGGGYIGTGVYCGKRKVSRPPTERPLTNAVIVLDLSGSVRERADSREIVEHELVMSLSRLTPGTAFNVVCFARTAVSFSRTNVPATEGNIAAAIAFVRALCHEPGPVSKTGNSISQGGGTSRLDAGIRASFEHKPDEILIISDGGAVVREGNRSLSQREILERIHKAIPEDRPVPVIHTISTSPAGSGLLRKLAKDYEGEYREQRDP